ncbi:MAG TPA: MobA/MobL family protein [Clostridiales bacterium]|nr:MobA/MobL family protein [Clostridiales bacterium]
MAEKNSNAQLAREIEIALPVELTRERNISLAREYAKRHFVSAGMCADVCVHDKGDGNPHAHIMLTLRPFEPDGSWGAKSKKEYILDRNGERILLKSGAFKTRKIYTVDWNEPTKAEEWRAAWADAVNAELERRGLAERIDHRSYGRQGIEQIPTIHLGVAASQMERKGIVTNRGDINRDIEVSNKLIRQLRARIRHLTSWIKAETKNAEPPTLADVIRGILDRQEQKSKSGRYRAPYNLKMAANMLNFLVRNNIKDMPGLRDKVRELYERQVALGGELNRIGRRVKTLDEHLKQAGYYRQHREIFRQYQAIAKPKRREKFRSEHHAEISLYEAAKRYLDDVMDGRSALPVKAWRDERGRLAVERSALNREYGSLKSEVKEMEHVRRGMEDMLRGERQKAWPPRLRGMER